MLSSCSHLRSSWAWLAWRISRHDLPSSSPPPPPPSAPEVARFLLPIVRSALATERRRGALGERLGGPPGRRRLGTSPACPPSRLLSPLLLSPLVHCSSGFCPRRLLR